MSRQYDRYERSRRASPGPRKSALGHWGPLIMTVTVATIGLAAWVWSERKNDDEEEDAPRRPKPDTFVGQRPDGTFAPPPNYRELQPGETAYGTTTRPSDETTYIARMSGALKRTPSPQQFIDGASRTVVAGMAAAGAVVGSALSSIREEDKNAYKDHKTWSEEAESRKPGESPKVGAAKTDMTAATQGQRGTAAQNYGKRKTVAVVISADADNDGFDDGEGYEHASILSHLPKNTDFSKVRLFVLIYSPDLKAHPLDGGLSNPPVSLSSSFSNIGYDQTQTPGDERKSHQLSPATPTFNALWLEAQGIVEKETMVIPFTTSSGHVHILRHLSPDCVYLQESLAGTNGNVITHLQTWLRQDVVLVVGADGGHGGLADSESEADNGKAEQWWEREDRVGRGRGIAVVEGLRVGDDWARRIQGKE